MTQLEFWPDYGKGPLWTERGTAVALDEISLPADLAERLRAWNRQYSEEKIPIDGAGDAAWLREGTDLLRRTRGALGSGYQIVVTEPWWGEESRRDTGMSVHAVTRWAVRQSSMGR